MAFASVGSFGTADSVIAGTTLALTPTATLEVGNLAVLIVAMDNEDQTATFADNGRFHDSVQSITDTGGNVWRCIGTNQDSRGGNNGSATATFMSVITTQLTTGSTITATFKNSITSKAMTGWEYTIGSPTISIESLVRSYSQAADPASMTLDDLPSREYLVIRGVGTEGSTGTWVGTTNYTSFTSAVANTGTGGSSMIVDGEFRIITGTTATSDPSRGTFDSASTFVALFEGNPTIPVVTHGGLFSAGASGDNPAWPKPHRPGDIALLVIEALGGETVSLGTPAGFAEVPGSPQNTSETKLAVFWCRATSDAMASPNVTDPGNHLILKMFLIQQCIEFGDPWNATAGSANDTPSTSVSVTGLTTTVDNCLVLSISANGTDLGTKELSGWTNASLTRLSELDVGQSNVAGGGGWSVARGRKAVAGAVSASTATLVTSSDQANLMIAFRPPAVSVINLAGTIAGLSSVTPDMDTIVLFTRAICSTVPRIG